MCTPEYVDTFLKPTGKWPTIFDFPFTVAGEQPGAGFAAEVGGTRVVLGWYYGSTRVVLGWYWCRPCWHQLQRSARPPRTGRNHCRRSIS